MSTKQPAVTGKELLKLLTSLGFEITRIKGSHPRLKHPDGRVTTVAVHNNDEIPKGLLRKIVREDVGIDMDTFAALLKD